MLPSLTIKNFRCLEDLTFNHLARVNLLVGRNNVGKSTVLEALRIYAGNANFDLLSEIAASHDENFGLIDKTNYAADCLAEELFHNRGISKNDIAQTESKSIFEDLFFNRKISKDDVAKILIGESNTENQNSLIIYRMFTLKRPKERGIETTLSLKKIESLKECFVTQSMAVNKNGITFKFYEDCFLLAEQPFIKCSLIPTQFISIDELAREWDKIVYTENEKIVIDALKIILPDFEHLVFIENTRKDSNRIAKVKLSNLPHPVSLKSLGDGMIRILQIALKLATAQGGFLLIDEFENGLHYSVQEKVWDLLFQMAEQLDVQIFVTTHSWDCVKSFRTVWEKEGNEDKGSFHRLFLHSIKNKIDVMPYQLDTLDKSIERDVEVR